MGVPGVAIVARADLEQISAGQIERGRNARSRAGVEAPLVDPLRAAFVAVAQLIEQFARSESRHLVGDRRAEARALAQAQGHAIGTVIEALLDPAAEIELAHAEGQLLIGAHFGEAVFVVDLDPAAEGDRIGNIGVEFRTEDIFVRPVATAGFKLQLEVGSGRDIALDAGFDPQLVIAGGGARGTRLHNGAQSGKADRKGR